MMSPEEQKLWNEVNEAQKAYEAARDRWYVVHRAALDAEDETRIQRRVEERMREQERRSHEKAVSHGA
jgi:hypothetical protein